MSKSYCRMELEGEGRRPRGEVLARVAAYDADAHHDKIPLIYTAAFKEGLWQDDWDDFEEFDPAGVFVSTAAATGEPDGFVICFRRRDFGYISVVAVLPEVRRRGIATALLERAVKYLRSRGLRRIVIDAESDNVAPVSTYEAYGFREAARFED